MLTGKTVVLAVTGSIAAYKIANLARMLKKLHADVQVLMTQNATNFINPITLETLTNQKCLIDTFDRNFQYSVEHIALAKRADVVLVAPASANVIGKLANGIAEQFKIDKRKSASILDTFSCVVQGIIPYGAQMLIAAELTGLSPISIIGYLYYPMILGVVALLSIFFRYPRRYS